MRRLGLYPDLMAVDDCMREGSSPSPPTNYFGGGIVSVIDYDNIRKSIENELGTGSRGWTRILETAFTLVKARAEKKSLHCPDVCQIKEKFGELRVYYDHTTADDYQKTYIAAALEEAKHSCECCGNATRPQMVGNWVVILCCWCAHDRLASNGQNAPRFNARVLLDDPLRCHRCGFVGQVAWKTSGHRCPACVAKGA